MNDVKSEQSVFLEALEIGDPRARAAFLKSACQGDEKLLAAVHELLKAHEDDDQFLDRSPLVATANYNPAEDAGTLIGPYKLLQPIGEGGFGVVYMAEQERPVRRMVALKIIKPGMDTAQVIARFESERQALALMDHPNIARVLDAGATPSGRPYFVMELVKGVPITEFCDKNQMPADRRLKLFIDICHAIQHAHQKGVIHRDIKPSNVMVTLHDGVPVVKVIDFGVAKATVQKLTEKTLFTAYGQMIGTPTYMSPEQAEMSGLDIDTRSDIYSLGVLLYELLTGTTPLESKRLRRAGYAEMQRMIREDQPPRPSTRLSSLGQAATILAGNRGAELKQLTSLLAGDLDWIVMKALEKDRNRRYGTPANFAEDIERYLHGEAILARPPSTIYQLKKFIRRHRAAVLAAAAVSAALLLGTGVAIWQAIVATNAESTAVAALGEKEKALAAAVAEKTRTEQERRRADKAAAVSDAVNDFLVKDLLGRVGEGAFAGGPDVKPDPNITARALIDRAAQSIGDRLQDQPEVEAAVQQAIANSYYSLGSVDRSLVHWRRAAELKSRVAGEAHFETLTLWLVYVETAMQLNQRDEALRVLDNVHRSILPAMGSPQSSGIWLRLGRDYLRLGRKEEANQSFERYLAAAPQSEDLESRSGIAAAFSRVGVYRMLGQSENAERLFGKAQDAALRMEREKSPDASWALVALADQLRELGRQGEAIPIYVRARKLCLDKDGAIRPKTPWFAATTNLGYTYMEAGRPADAIPLWQELNRNQRSGPYSDWFLNQLWVLAASYDRAGRPLEAIPLLEQVRDGYLAAEGPDGKNALPMAIQLGSAYCRTKRWADGARVLEDALPRFKAVNGRDYEGVKAATRDLARCYKELGTPDKALPLLQELVDGERPKLEKPIVNRREVLQNIADLLREMGKPADAIALLKTQTETKPDDPAILSLYADELARQGNWKDAASMLERAFDLQPSEHGLILSTAAAALGADDLEGYHRICRKAFDQFRATDDPVAADRTAKAGLIVAKPDNLPELARLAQVAVEKGAMHEYLHYFQFARGLAAYRSGDWSGALEWCTLSRRPGSEDMSLVTMRLLVQSMARQRLNQPIGAGTAMREATHILDEHRAASKDDRGNNWPDWLMCEIVLREAKSLIGTE